ncbi:MAG: CTP synthetase [Verrucomicrobiales bacterium]|mgnify:FL=1|nr:CTP synthetase [Verrucomicrobiales bacterium]MBV64019.1 CTP synthetase [Rickettsiales bacterium]|tara:strand:- start:760 stop:2412 length:1653 start_codon:yes stop_codon:yes gene_type:complete
MRKTKFIFVTGGVVSSLGKGLAAASLGTLLEKRGHKVLLQKFDPYLNVDPGTMSPFQHGEVYVLDDGAETDLDLGHYERFTSGVLSKLNNLTSGQVYETVIKKERKGDYLGKTVQVIPHVTNEIKGRIYEVENRMDADIIITEIGGTVGDIEGLPFLEALRQFVQEVGPDNALFIHVTLVPYIGAAGELKTKPTQQSIAKLREIGIQPQVVLLRSELPVEEDAREKISMFCNVPSEAVIECRDVPHSIYELPLYLHEEKLDDIVCDRLGLPQKKPNLKAWQEFVWHVIDPSHETKIAVVGKYIELQDAYKSIYEALTHAGAANDCRVLVERIDAEDLENDEDIEEKLDGIDGLLIPGGFGDRGTEGKINAANFARTRGIPYFGICLGMQIATIEFARNVAKLEGANSTEFDQGSAHPVICLLEEQKSITHKGASMRLGTWVCDLKPKTKSFDLYNSSTINERHRHRYEFNSDYKEKLEEAGLIVAGTSPDGSLVEIIELDNHPFYVGAQFHPEFLSKPNYSHPLFKGFVAAALARRIGVAKHAEKNASRK